MHLRGCDVFDIGMSRKDILPDYSRHRNKRRFEPIFSESLCMIKLLFLFRFFANTTFMDQIKL